MIGHMHLDLSLHMRACHASNRPSINATCENLELETFIGSEAEVANQSPHFLSQSKVDKVHLVARQIYCPNSSASLRHRIWDNLGVCFSNQMCGTALTDWTPNV